MPIVNYTVVNGEVIAEKRDGVRRTYVPDPLGSTVALLDDTQAQTDTFTYWPYGEERSRTGATPTTFTFVGALGYRSTTRHNYIRARHLSRNTSRWITADPLSSEPNAYTYAQGNPITHIDPTGLQPIQIILLCRRPLIPSGHGNFCGAGRVGPDPPCDCIDVYCKSHDKCLQGNPSRAERRQCDFDLCVKAKACLSHGCASRSHPVSPPCSIASCRGWAYLVGKNFCRTGAGSDPRLGPVPPRPGNESPPGLPPPIEEAIEDIGAVFAPLRSP